MITFGDDSLNEHTEDEGLEADGSLDLLRVKLGKNTVPVESPEPAGSEQGEDSEPSRGQLIATGEAEPDTPEEGGQGEEKEKGVTSTSLAIREKELSIRKQIEEGLLAGETRDELIARGFNKRSIQTIASELKSKMHTRTPLGKATTTTAKGLPIFAKGSPPEAIIDSIEVPDVTDGQGVPFEQGIKFGMSLIILGVRVAQELSGIGITQAKPIVDMAKSMREGEAMAAKNAAGEAAMEAAGMVRDSMMPLLTNISRSGGGEGGDPVKAMMVRTMEPIMQRLMGSMLGRLAPGTAPLQITEGQGKVEGWSRRSE